jgi:aconitate hydratase
MKYAMNGKAFKENYEKVATDPGKLWEQGQRRASGQVYNWPTSTYIAKPPFFDGFTMTPAQAAGQNLWRQARRGHGAVR